MPDLDFSAFNLTDEDLEGIDPNDLVILDKPIPPEKPEPEQPKEEKTLQHPDKFLFTAEEFLAGIEPDKNKKELEST